MAITLSSLPEGCVGVDPFVAFMRAGTERLSDFNGLKITIGTSRFSRLTSSGGGR